MNSFSAFPRNTNYCVKNDHRINHLPNSNIHKLKLAKTRLCIIMLCLSGAAVIICTALKIRCFFELCLYFLCSFNWQTKVKVVFMPLSFLNLSSKSVSAVFHCRSENSFLPTWNPTVDTGSESDPGGSRCQAVSSNVLSSWLYEDTYTRTLVLQI